MKDIIKIVVAILLIILAWKLFVGVLGIAVIVGAVGLLIWGGKKLLEGPKS
jgi:hypothetical protein